MLLFRPRNVFLCALILFCACTRATPTTSATLKLEKCTLWPKVSMSALEAECGELEVPQNYAEPEGKRIKVYVARIPASGGDRRNDPIVFIPGGPGQAAIESYIMLGAVFAEANRKRDVILIDPRGTGRSTPLTCKELEDRDPLLAPQGDEHDVDLIVRCASQLPVDAKHFHTDAEVEDFERVRQALGITKWNLYGGSYGTRVAQRYAQKHPEVLRSMVLDGVIAPETPLGMTHAESGEAALDAWIKQCNDDTECQARFPNVKARMIALRDRLQQTPADVHFSHPSTLKTVHMLVDGEALTQVVRFSLYSPEAAQLLFFLLEDAESEAGLARLAAKILPQMETMTKLISPLVNYTVGCREDVPFYPAEDAMTKQPFFGHSIAPHMRAVCEKFPHETPPKDARTASPLATPTLLISGGRDPVTPASQALMAMTHIARNKHITVSGMGHINAGRGCMPHQLAEFFEAGNADKLDLSCANAVGAGRIWLGPNGP